LSIILPSAAETPTITIRDIKALSEIREVEAVQKSVWGIDDLDVVPVTMLVATREVGAVLIGAYENSSLVGFVYGFPGYENRHAVHHSHMLAVSAAYRNHNLGYKLKLAQRERALAQGLKRITWTFDPLQSLNAHFNFRKLGVLADAYKINFYGEATSSFLHQSSGTDRLWVNWQLDHARVRERLQSNDHDRATPTNLDGIVPLVRVGPDNLPQWGRASGQKCTTIEIPADINALQRQSPDVVRSWREATRWAFTEALSLGYQVEDFCIASRDERSVGVYLLNARLI
jgi:predicted GNAT superfamily acetyltransferase